MSEPDSGPPIGNDLAASTAEFRAFAERTDDQRRWAVRAPGRSVGLLVGAAVVVAVVLAVVVALVVG